MKGIWLLLFLILGELQGQIVHSESHSYHMLKKIGHGNFGEVFSAEDETGALVALKRYRKYFRESTFSYLYSDGMREYERGQLLDHPLIARSIEYFESEDERYLVLEYAPGKDINKWPMHTLSCQEATTACFQLLEAIRYAFISGYLYIDLTDTNVRFDGSQIKLIDLASFLSIDELKYHYEMAQGDERMWARHLVFVIRSLTDVCSQIWNKTTLPRKERLQYRLRIKQVSWEMIEDFFDMGLDEFEKYIDEIILVINSFDFK